jgi:hypothetical protein
MRCSTTTSTAGTCRSAAAALLATGPWTGTFLVLPLVILLFPDGHLPPRWRRVLWAYLADAGLVAAYFLGAAAWAVSRQPVAVDAAGQLIKQPNPPGLVAVAAVLIAMLPVFWVLFVVRQVLSWRRAAGVPAAAQVADERGGHDRSRTGRHIRVRVRPVAAGAGDRRVRCLPISGAMDLDSVRDDLAAVVHEVLRPARVSVWVCPHD